MRYGEDLLGDEVIPCNQAVRNYIVSNVITKMRKKMNRCIYQTRLGQEIELNPGRTIKKLSKVEENIPSEENDEINQLEEFIQYEEQNNDEILGESFSNEVNDQENKDDDQEDEFTTFMKKIDDCTWREFHQILGTRNFLLISLKYQRYTKRLNDEYLCYVFNISMEELNAIILKSLRLIKAYLINDKENKDELLKRVDEKVLEKK